MLRTAGIDDGARIARIQLAAWRETYGQANPGMVASFELDRTAENWARAAVDPTHRLLIAERDGTAVGYAFSGAAEGDVAGVGEVHAVYLLQSAHGLGIGRLLVEDAIAALAAAGCTECVLWVAEFNGHARGFYEHLGFRADGGQDVWRGLHIVRYRRLIEI